MRLLKLLALFFISSSSLFSQAPSAEVRAAWVTTNWGLDWPTQGASVKTQKEELVKILDLLYTKNFNTVLFQARAQGCVFYKSKIEPLSRFFNHAENFDPLAFAIEECHKRNMECHAWIIAFPMEKAKMNYTGKGRKRKGTVVNDKPSYYKAIDDRWYLDPGRPETRNLINSIVTEIVSNYDVDGVHFDYIRYPSNTRKFPDEDSYKKYGNGMNLHDWRRDNINKLVGEVYDNVKSIKKWVQVSSSPLGRYRILPEVSANDGWTAYETVFQDAGSWMLNGKHDLVFPMMYHRERYFYPFLDDWVANSNGRIVVPGLGIYQMSEQNWSLSDILNQMKYIRDTKVQGQAYFRVENIMNNLKGITDSLYTYYPTPAKLPPLTWLDNEAPEAPINFEVYKDNEGYLNIKWDAPTDKEDLSYTVYASPVENMDINNAKYILTTGLRKNNYSFLANVGEFGYYYFVAASDRYHNESKTCFPAFFSHSQNEQ